MKQDVFETLSVSRAVMAQGLPTIAAMSVNAAFSMADLMFIGMTGDANQITVSAMLMPINMIFMSVGAIFGIGGASCISRDLGGGLWQRAVQTSSFCIYASVFFGVVCTGVGLIFLESILSIIGVGSTIYGLAEGCATIIMWGTVPNMLNFVLNQMLRARGAAKQSMCGMMLGSLVTLVLNPILILAMGLGVRGAALSAIAGDLASILYFLRFVLRDDLLSIRFKDFFLGRKSAKAVLVIGIPVCIANFLACSSNMVFNRLAFSYGGDTVAAFGVASRAMMVPVMAGMALAKGSQPLIGYHYAAGNWKKMKETISFTMKLGTLSCVFFTVLVFFKGDVLIKLFTNDPDVVTLGTHILQVTLVVIPIFAIEAVLQNAMQAMGKALAVLILSVAKQWMVCIPLMLFLESNYGLTGLVLLDPIREYLTTFMVVICFVVVMRTHKQASKGIEINGKS